MKVLVLDDHLGLREEVVAMLARNGHDADGVDSAVAAVPLAETGRYDFILVDFAMPEHDGLWFMKNVRMPRRTKAILVTGHANRQLIDRMFRAGIAGYLIKPFEETDLIRHLDFHAHGAVLAVDVGSDMDMDRVNQGEERKAET
jgi:CheY-like chemotaxis protein